MNKAKTIMIAASSFAFTLAQVPVLADILVRSMPREANLGDKVTVTIQSVPGANCKLEAQSEGLSQAFALMPVKANKAGTASWTFDINRNYKANKLPLVFTCSSKDKVEQKVAAININSSRAEADSPQLTLIKAPSVVPPGQKIAITVHSTPKAHLKIEAGTETPLSMLALRDQVANQSGDVSWQFDISKNYKSNCLPVIITSELNGVQKKLITAIDVGNKTASTAKPPLY